MTQPSARDLLAIADTAKRTAAGASVAESLINLGHQPVVRRGLLAILRGPKDEDHMLTPDETRAVLHALAKVRVEHERIAADCEARVEVRT